MAEAAQEAATGSQNGKQYRRHSSKSEWAEENKKGESKCRVKCFEWPFMVKDPTSGKCLSEATGWAMDAVARGPLNQAGAFLGNAILFIATREAAVTGSPTVYGFKPSSLLTFITAMVGIAAALLMPIAGAIVDHTRHRKTVGVVTAWLLVIITGLQLLIKKQEWWFPVLILEGFGGFFMIVHITAVLAYLPDLTNNEEGVVNYTSRFNVSQYLIQTIYVGIILIITNIKGEIPINLQTAAISPQLAVLDQRVDRNVFVAIVSLVLAVIIGALFLGYSWTLLFRKRPPLSDVPPGSNLLTAGIVQVSRTVPTIWRKYHALKWLMISLLWSPEQGAGVVLSIGLTWVTLFLRMNADQVGYISLILLGAIVPGSLFSKYCCQWFNPLNSYRLAQFSLAAAIGLSVGLIPGPDYQKRIYGFAALWGFPFGWLYASQRVLFVTLIPKGQETEIMGLFTFFGQSLGWLPPVIFTIMNQNDVDIRWGVALLPLFYILAMFCTFMMGSYQTAKDIVDDEWEAKMRAEEEAEGLEPAKSEEEQEVSDQTPEDLEHHEENYADNEDAAMEA